MVWFHLIRVPFSIVGCLLHGQRGHRHFFTLLKIVEVNVRIPSSHIQPGHKISIYHGVALVGGVGYQRSLDFGCKIVGIYVPVLVSSVGPDYGISINPGLGLPGRVGADGGLNACGQIVLVDIPASFVPIIDPDDIVAVYYG